MTQQLERLLGPTLLGKNGATVPTSSVNAEIVGLYFSAHWWDSKSETCPPCRQFTPVLARRYSELKAKRRNFELEEEAFERPAPVCAAVTLEEEQPLSWIKETASVACAARRDKIRKTYYADPCVVFVSSDNDRGSFQEYFQGMPWLALPFEDRQRKAQLSQMFGISGIPTLVLVDSAGRLIDRNGRQKVMEPLFEQQVGLQVDPEVKGLTLESIIDVMSTDLTLDHEARLAGYSTLYKVVNNILQNPGDPKYLTLKKNNATVQAKLANRGFIKILKLAGFEETADSYKCSEYPDNKKLKEIRDVLKSLVSSMQ